MSIERFFGFYPVLFLIHCHDGVFFTQLLEELAQWEPGDSKSLAGYFCSSSLQLGQYFVVSYIISFSLGYCF
jgi:hypothetical protein